LIVDKIDCKTFIEFS